MLLGLYTPALHKSALQNVFILDPCMIAVFKEAYAVTISLCKTLCKFRGYRYIFDPLLVLPLVSYPNSPFRGLSVFGHFDPLIESEFQNVLEMFTPL